jgi:hypothetical protein
MVGLMMLNEMIHYGNKQYSHGKKKLYLQKSKDSRFTLQVAFPLQNPKSRYVNHSVAETNW